MSLRKVRAQITCAVTEGGKINRFIDAYAVLGVAPDASADELKAAYRRLARREHPDLAPPAGKAEATRALQAINVAYGLVADPPRRAEYDRLRRAHMAGRVAGSEWDDLLRKAGRWAGRQRTWHPAPLADTAYRLGRRVGRWLSP